MLFFNRTVGDNTIIDKKDKITKVGNIQLTLDI